MHKHMSIGIQLMFDEFTNDIVEEPIKHWKTVDDVPEYIKSYILNIVSTRVIYDSSTKQYHCSKCLKLLDEDYYCNNCYKQCKKPNSIDSKYVIHTSINNIEDYYERTKYFVFDIVDGQVLIYIFNIDTYYYNKMIYIPYQLNKISIEEIYHVTKDGVNSLLNDDTALFEDYCKEQDDNYNFDLLNVFDLQMVNHYLYTDNLDILKETSLYKYTSIWELKDFFENNKFNLSSLTYYPICCKQFEYLIKMKLYSLAATCPHIVEYCKNFKDTFGVDKKYYSFMKDIDINISQLNALRLCPTTDIDVINFVSTDTYLFEELSKYVKADKIMMYFKNQKLDFHNISEYYDYIRCCEEMKLNLKDNDILFPKHFIKQHDKITNEMIIASDPQTDKRIKSLSNILMLNKYEDDKYVIFPADSVSSLIDESSQLSNCVRTYCDIVSHNECQIYFMRYKNNINKSFVTIEVRDGKVVQAKTRFNEDPSLEIMNVIRKWEQTLILITNY